MLKIVACRGTEIKSTMSKIGSIGGGKAWMVETVSKSSLSEGGSKLQWVIDREKELTSISFKDEGCEWTKLEAREVGREEKGVTWICRMEVVDGP
jgi:hypothetical protein